MEKKSPKTGFLLLLFFSCWTLVSCGSEKANDKKIAAAGEEKKEKPIVSPKPLSDDQQGQPIPKFDPKVPEAPPLSCAAPLTLEVVLNPDSPGGSQTILVAKLAPACFVNRYPVVRLKVDRLFRLAAPVDCKAGSLADFNFECTGTVGQFVSGEFAIVPVSVTSSTTLQNLKGEIEYLEGVPP